MVTDPIADMLTRIRNALTIKKLDVVVFGTKKDLSDSGMDDTLTRYIDERFSEYGINPVWIELFT